MSNNTNQKPLATISIVSHGNTPEIGRLLDSLAEHEQAERLQVILTDNLGAVIPALDESKWNSLTILRNEHPRGFAHNHNAAFRLARGSYFCIVNPDVVFIEGILGTLIKDLEAGHGDIVAPLVIDSQGLVQDSFRDLPSPLELFRRRALGRTPVPRIPTSETAISPHWIAGIFLLMRSETFSQLGGMDERYRLYFEDVDFCSRARLQGFSLRVNAGVKVQHDAHRSSRRDIRYLYWHLQSAIRFFFSDVYRQIRKEHS